MKIELNFKENPNWDKLVMEAIKLGLSKALIFLTNETKRLTPVDTGRLRNSYMKNIEIDGKRINGILETDVEYAKYLEFSTKKPRGQGEIPFMRPALYNNQDKITAIVSREMKALL